MRILYKFDDIDFSSELLDTLKLFFKDDEIAHSSDIGHELPLDTFFLYGYIVERDGLLFYLIKVEYLQEGNEYTIQLSNGIPGRFDLDERKCFKRDIKRGIYCLLSNKTGRELPWGILTGIRPAKIVHEMMARGFDKSEIEQKMHDYYMLSPDKANLLYDVASVEKTILDASSSEYVSIYIGIPFCISRCLYCSFTSYPIKRYSDLVSSYITALKKELHYIADVVRLQGRRILSIYIGGGTPTSISVDELGELLNFIESTLDLSNLKEFTLEAGRPDSIDVEKLAVIKKSAVDRISINPQTMNDDTLRLIGRSHTKEDFLKVFKLAREMGFDNINTDLIIGLPGENARVFVETLKQISELSPESLTVHTMAVKRASRFNMDKKSYDQISENEASLMVDTARKYANDMGMHPYYLYRQKNMLGNLENIGYCKPGFESRYNVQIMEEKQSILAVGAGAITKLVWPEEDRIERAFNVKDVDEYITRIDEMIERKRKLYKGCI